jgi:hypothetical protein
MWIRCELYQQSWDDEQELLPWLTETGQDWIFLGKSMVTEFWKCSIKYSSSDCFLSWAVEDTQNGFIFISK